MGETVFSSMKPLARRTHSYDIGAGTHPMAMFALIRWVMVARRTRSYDIGAGTHPMAMVARKTY